MADERKQQDELDQVEQTGNLQDQFPEKEASGIADFIEDETVDVNEAMEKFDKEAGAMRKLTGMVGKAVAALAVAMSLFHMYTAFFGTLLSMRQRSLHIIFAFVIGFMLYPMSKKSKAKHGNRIPYYDYLLALVAVIVFGYLFVNFQAIAIRGGIMETQDYVLGFMAILVVLEITRRVVGPELPIVAIIFILYAKFGPMMPGLLAHRGYSWRRIISQMYMTTEGILGIPIGVSATFVFMFILFGAFLDKTGVGKFFIDMAFGLTGHLKSGPAMSAVVASGFMGSISGSSVANTVTTGAFTIPLMKKVGYKPHFAGAVEAASSTGGQIMPPVMGAAAFIMAEFTGIAYVNIVIAAIIPALLYYFAVGAIVHLEASKLGLEGIPKDRLPNMKKLLLTRGYLFIPLFVIVYLLISGRTPLFAAIYSIMTAVALATLVSLITIFILKKKADFTWRDFVDALEQGAKGAVSVACACACAGIIVGVVTLTGLGLRVAELIVTLAQGMLLPTLFFTMIASIILGMGLPTTAKYIVLATMAVPALIRLDVNLLSAHLFVLYFGVIADITPPVALAAYAGAGIAGANAMKTGFQAVKLALAAFIVPYLFALDSHLILVKEVQGSTVIFYGFFESLPVIIPAIMGTFCLACAVANYFVTKNKIYETAIMFIAAITLMNPGIYTDLIGLVVIAGVYLLQKARVKKMKAEAV
ncbi:TRAP transporter permease [Anoxynatronum buryatiense]|uniref:TRAP transporter, 4TM/12TM fusion protein n=1 Tax=Anoxynatronum buryatiense TaxID=489973 RepID=A0AA45WTV7_9CLOT|nr:TRAP transporter permease [Anoxynatronum buryatiense]SMP44855.1 TRAP transporter, 4TM/12TM fusion protein [Anoxynatronum buryatiense]